jgi:hypothetical protein
VVSRPRCRPGFADWPRRVDPDVFEEFGCRGAHLFRPERLIRVEVLNQGPGRREHGGGLGTAGVVDGERLQIEDARGTRTAVRLADDRLAVIPGRGGPSPTRAEQGWEP